MTLLERLWSRARAHPQRIVLTEGEDERVIAGAARAVIERYARPTLLGRAAVVRANSDRAGVKLDGIEVVDPASSARVESYAQILFEQRRSRGITFEEAYELCRKPLHFALVRVVAGEADGAIGGPAGSVGEIARAAAESIGLDAAARLVSSFALVALERRDGGTVGHNNSLLFADCGVVSERSAHELAEIAIQSAESARLLFESEPRVALLCGSEPGSGSPDRVEKIAREATRIAKAREPGLAIDGGLAPDTAIAQSIAQREAPGSMVAGRANVLVFPDLNSANIASRLVQQLAAAVVIGPILQGLARPVGTVTRICSAGDVADAIAVTSIQAIAGKEVASAAAEA